MKWHHDPSENGETSLDGGRLHGDNRDSSQGQSIRRVPAHVRKTPARSVAAQEAIIFR
jgi:hypothetical protein